MPDAARLFDQPPAPLTGPSWSGELHGEVGAMHRAIEQRLLSGAFDLAVVPLPVRPGEELIARVSRTVGWLALASGAAGAVTMAWALLG